MAGSKGRRFEKAFTDGLKFSGRPGTLRIISTHAVGTVEVLSGALIIGDPIAPVPLPPLDLRVPLVPCAVTLSVLNAPGDCRVACAKLAWADSEVVGWERAKVLTQSGKPRAYSVSVNSGTACFSDAMAWSHVMTDPSLVEKERAARAGGPGESFEVREAQGPCAMIGFSSGYGDGNYSVWIGFDAKKNPVNAIIDFELLNEETWSSELLTIVTSGDVKLEKLDKVDLRLQILDRWKSKPYESSNALALRYSVPFMAALPEFEIVDDHGQAIPVAKSEIDPRETERLGRWLYFESQSPFPRGWRLRVSVKTGERSLTAG